jgi:hypothetical protein
MILPNNSSEVKTNEEVYCIGNHPDFIRGSAD